MILVDGQAGDCIPVRDRGLAYGDGIFRTLRAREGRPLLWRWQWRCLRHDCAALGLACPDEAVWLADIAACCAGLTDATVKLMLTRGEGRRGYAPPPDARPTRIVQASAFMPYPAHWYTPGVSARVCDLRLGHQPRLAGIKHLNRLENVLARGEWNDPEVQDGLLLDGDGLVIETTMCNVFLLEGGRLVTPRLDRCGVAGALRAWLLEAAPQFGFAPQEDAVPLERLLAADAVWLGNSLLGLAPLAQLDERRWSTHPRYPDALAALGF